MIIQAINYEYVEGGIYMKRILPAILLVLFCTAISSAYDSNFKKMDEGNVSSAYDNDFKKMDENNDGKISKKEYIDTVIKNFNKIDKNKDGFLTKDELQAVGKIDAEKFLKEEDLNKDGKISKEEFIKAAEKRFKILDKNNDGFIDQKEWSSIKGDVNPDDSKIPLVAPFIIFKF